MLPGLPVGTNASCQIDLATCSSRKRGATITATNDQARGRALFLGMEMLEARCVLEEVDQRPNRVQ